MNTRKEFQDALHQTAETVEYQARRAGRAVQDTAKSLSGKMDPGAFFATALSWVDDILTPQNRALAGRALSAAAILPRRHPGVAAVLGLGALYMMWQRSKESNSRRMVEEFASRNGDAWDLGREARKNAERGYQTAAKASRDLRESVQETAHRAAESGRTAAAQFGTAAAAAAQAVRGTYEQTREQVSEGVEKLTDTARHIREDAEAGYRKAKEFAKEEPALAIAGGVALAIGALLLVKSSRR